MALPDNRYIIVNYHYVRDPDPLLSGIVPCSVSDFESQVKLLTEQYSIVSVPDVWEAAQYAKTGRFCALTFDDGLMDHYSRAFPILKKYNTTGTFFFIASVFEGALPSAHALHVLLSIVSTAECVRMLSDFLKIYFPRLREAYAVPADRRLTGNRLHENILTANLKEILMRMPQDVKSEFLRDALRVRGQDADQLRDTIFMNMEQAREIKKSGMEVGVHSYAHTPLDDMDGRAIEEDARQAKQILSDALGQLSSVYSYPHGRIHAAGISAIAREGFRYGVTIERRNVIKSDGPFEMPRYDTMDLRKEIVPQTAI